jgi:hypothetical protein
MTQSIERPAVDVQTRARDNIPGALWRLAGGLAIAHIVLMLAGFSQEKSAMLTDGADVVKRTYVGANVSRVWQVVMWSRSPSSYFCRSSSSSPEPSASGPKSDAGDADALAAGVCYVAITLGLGCLSISPSPSPSSSVSLSRGTSWAGLRLSEPPRW